MALPPGGVRRTLGNAVSHRLYLDSRDLIELLANNNPMSVPELQSVLRQRDSLLVYSFANVCEATIPADLTETGRRARDLHSLPHIFIRPMPPIRCLEFAEAIRAFQIGTAPRLIDPYVNSWHQTFLYPHQDMEMAAASKFTFEEQVVFMVTHNPDVCRNLPERTARVQLAVDQDRAVTDPVRRNRERFEGGVAVALADCGLPMPTAEKKRFAAWVRQDPMRCPSWRLFDEGYLKFASNVSDAVDRGDAHDWSHVSVLPYVDALTLDRRIAGYARAAADALRQQNPACRYGERVFSNTETWLRAG